MKYERLSSVFCVKKLSDCHISEILALYRRNPLYFKHCPPSPDEDTVKGDLHALPNGKSAKDKYFLGFYDKNSLVAVMDLITCYPDRDTAFIGLFMVAEARQGIGTGSRIISECLHALKSMGFGRVRLAAVDTNDQAKRFWEKNGFSPTGEKYPAESYTLVCMEKQLR